MSQTETGKILEDDLKVAIKIQMFNIMEWLGFREDPNLALMAGAAIGYKTALKDVQKGITSNKLGGRGKCRYCGKEYNNVAYHEAHECKESGARDNKREEGVCVQSCGSCDDQLQAIECELRTLTDKVDRLKSRKQDIYAAKHQHWLNTQKESP